MIDEQETHHHVVTSYKDAPTRTIAAGGVNFAYRELGPKTGVPVIFLTHLAAVLDNWDPRVVDGIAAKHSVITFDNRGAGASTGSTPDTIRAMAKDAITFIRALGPVPLEYSIVSLTCAVISRLVGLPGAAQDRVPASSPATQPRCPGVPRGPGEGC
jgi:hypothetical protein